MKNQKSHYRQVSYHVYYTYIQTSNQANKNKNQSKGTKIPKTKQNIQKVKSFTKIYGKRVYDSPSHLNLTTSSLGAEQPQPTAKIQNTIK